MWLVEAADGDVAIMSAGGKAIGVAEWQDDLATSFNAAMNFQKATVLWNV